MSVFGELLRNNFFLTYTAGDVPLAAMHLFVVEEVFDRDGSATEESTAHESLTASQFHMCRHIHKSQYLDTASRGVWAAAESLTALTAAMIFKQILFDKIFAVWTL